MKGRVGKTMGAVALAAASVLMTPLAAQAATEVPDCVALITALRDDTESSYFKNPERDQVGLVGKLDSAKSKITGRKIKKADAIININEFQSKVDTLLTQGKTNQATWDLLYAGLLDGVPTLHGPDYVRACIADLPS